MIIFYLFFYVFCICVNLQKIQIFDLNAFSICKKLDLKVFLTAERQFVNINQYNLQNYLRSKLFDTNSSETSFIYFSSLCDGKINSNILVKGGTDKIALLKNLSEVEKSGNVNIEFVNRNGYAYTNIDSLNIYGGITGLYNTNCEIVLVCLDKMEYKFSSGNLHYSDNKLICKVDLGYALSKSTDDSCLFLFYLKDSIGLRTNAKVLKAIALPELKQFYNPIFSFIKITPSILYISSTEQDEDSYSFSLSCSESVLIKDIFIKFQGSEIYFTTKALVNGKTISFELLNTEFIQLMDNNAKAEIAISYSVDKLTFLETEIALSLNVLELVNEVSIEDSTLVLSSSKLTSLQSVYVGYMDSDIPCQKKPGVFQCELKSLGQGETFNLELYDSVRDKLAIVYGVYVPARKDNFVKAFQITLRSFINSDRLLHNILLQNISKYSYIKLKMFDLSRLDVKEAANLPILSNPLFSNKVIGDKAYIEVDVLFDTLSEIRLSIVNKIVNCKALTNNVVNLEILSSINLIQLKESMGIFILIMNDNTAIEKIKITNIHDNKIHFDLDTRKYKFDDIVTLTLELQFTTDQNLLYIPVRDSLFLIYELFSLNNLRVTNKYLIIEAIPWFTHFLDMLKVDKAILILYKKQKVISELKVNYFIFEMYLTINYDSDLSLLLSNCDTVVFIFDKIEFAISFDDMGVTVGKYLITEISPYKFSVKIYLDKNNPAYQNIFPTAFGENAFMFICNESRCYYLLYHNEKLTIYLNDADTSKNLIEVLKASNVFNIPELTYYSSYIKMVFNNSSLTDLYKVKTYLSQTKNQTFLNVNLEDEELIELIDADQKGYTPLATYNNTETYTQLRNLEIVPERSPQIIILRNILDDYIDECEFNVPSLINTAKGNNNYKLLITLICDEIPKPIASRILDSLKFYFVGNEILCISLDNGFQCLLETPLNGIVRIDYLDKTIFSKEIKFNFYEHTVYITRVKTDYIRNDYSRLPSLKHKLSYYPNKNINIDGLEYFILMKDSRQSYKLKVSGGRNDYTFSLPSYFLIRNEKYNIYFINSMNFTEFDFFFENSVGDKIDFNDNNVMKSEAYKKELKNPEIVFYNKANVEENLVIKNYITTFNDINIFDNLFFKYKIKASDNNFHFSITLQQPAEQLICNINNTIACYILDNHETKYTFQAILKDTSIKRYTIELILDNLSYYFSIDIESELQIANVAKIVPALPVEICNLETSDIYVNEYTDVKIYCFSLGVISNKQVELYYNRIKVDELNFNQEGGNSIYNKYAIGFNLLSYNSNIPDTLIIIIGSYYRVFEINKATRPSSKSTSLTSLPITKLPYLITNLLAEINNNTSDEVTSKYPFGFKEGNDITDLDNTKQLDDSSGTLYKDLCLIFFPTEFGLADGGNNNEINNIIEILKENKLIQYKFDFETYRIDVNFLVYVYYLESVIQNFQISNFLFNLNISIYSADSINPSTYITYDKNILLKELSNFLNQNFVEKTYLTDKFYTLEFIEMEIVSSEINILRSSFPEEDYKFTVITPPKVLNRNLFEKLVNDLPLPGLNYYQEPALKKAENIYSSDYFIRLNTPESNLFDNVINDKFYLKLDLLTSANDLLFILHNNKIIIDSSSASAVADSMKITAVFNLNKIKQFLEYGENTLFLIITDKVNNYQQERIIINFNTGYTVKNRHLNIIDFSDLQSIEFTNNLGTDNIYLTDLYGKDKIKKIKVNGNVITFDTNELVFFSNQVIDNLKLRVVIDGYLTDNIIIVSYNNCKTLLSQNELSNNYIFDDIDNVVVINFKEEVNQKCLSDNTINVFDKKSNKLAAKFELLLINSTSISFNINDFSLYPGEYGIIYMEQYLNTLQVFMSDFKPYNAVAFYSDYGSLFSFDYISNNFYVPSIRHFCINDDITGKYISPVKYYLDKAYCDINDTNSDIQILYKYPNNICQTRSFNIIKQRVDIKIKDEILLYRDYNKISFSSDDITFSFLCELVVDGAVVQVRAQFDSLAKVFSCDIDLKYFDSKLIYYSILFIDRTNRTLRVSKVNLLLALNSYSGLEIIHSQNNPLVQILQTQPETTFKYFINDTFKGLLAYTLSCSFYTKTNSLIYKSTILIDNYNSNTIYCYIPTIQLLNIDKLTIKIGLCILSNCSDRYLYQEDNEINFIKPYVNDIEPKVILKDLQQEVIEVNLNGLFVISSYDLKLSDNETFTFPCAFRTANLLTCLVNTDMLGYGDFRVNLDLIDKGLISVPVDIATGIVVTNTNDFLLTQDILTDENKAFTVGISNKYLSLGSDFACVTVFPSAMLTATPVISYEDIQCDFSCSHLFHSVHIIYPAFYLRLSNIDIRLNIKCIPEIKLTSIVNRLIIYDQYTEGNKYPIYVQGYFDGDLQSCIIILENENLAERIPCKIHSANILKFEYWLNFNDKSITNLTAEFLGGKLSSNKISFTNDNIRASIDNISDFTVDYRVKFDLVNNSGIDSLIDSYCIVNDFYVILAVISNNQIVCDLLALKNVLNNIDNKICLFDNYYDDNLLNVIICQNILIYNGLEIANVYPTILFTNETANISFRSKTIQDIVKRYQIKCLLYNKDKQIYSDNVECSNNSCICISFPSTNKEETFSLSFEKIDYSAGIIVYVNKPFISSINKGYIIRQFDKVITLTGTNFKDGSRCIFTADTNTYLTEAVFINDGSIKCNTSSFNSLDKKISFAYLVRDNSIPVLLDSNLIDIVTIIVYEKKVILEPDTDTFTLNGIYDNRIAYSILIGYNIYPCTYINTMTISCSINDRYLLYKNNYTAQVYVDLARTWYELTIINLKPIEIQNFDYRLISSQGGLRCYMTFPNMNNIYNYIQYRSSLNVYFIKSDLSIALQNDSVEGRYYFVTPGISQPSLYFDEYFYISNYYLNF
jgi:hypothetical protein